MIKFDYIEKSQHASECSASLSEEALSLTAPDNSQLYNEIKELSIRKWKLVNEKTKEANLRYLVSKNSKKEKTKHITFKTLKLSEYLRTNKNTNISFSLRSGGLDIKTWNKWKYDDNLCVMCENKEENMEHLMECLEYGETKDFVWREVFET